MRFTFLVVALAQIATLAASAAPSFRVLEDSALGPTFAVQVSGDGSIVLGFAREIVPGTFDPRTLAFRWDGDGAPVAIQGDLELVGASKLVISNDGSTIAATGIVDAPGLPTTAQNYQLRDERYVPLPEALSATNLIQAISDDGRVIVTTDTRFEDGVASPTNLAAQGVSGDGRTLVGTLASGAPGFSTDGMAPEEITLPSDAFITGGPSTPVLGMSFDGSIVFGAYTTLFGFNLFRWEDGQAEALGGIGSTGLTAAMSGDGSVLVAGDALWIDLERHLLSEFLAGLGLDVAGWSRLLATDISSDGRTLVGTGLGPSGRRRSWIAVIPEPGTGGLLAAGIVALSGRAQRRRRSQLRTNPGPAVPLARGGETD